MRPQHEPYLSGKIDRFWPGKKSERIAMFSGSTGYDIMQVYQILNLRDEILFLALEGNEFRFCTLLIIKERFILRKSYFMLSSFSRIRSSFRFTFS